MTNQDICQARSRKLPLGSPIGPATAIPEGSALRVAIRACLATLALFGVFAFDVAPAEAWSKNQNAAQQRYLACKVKLQMHPPCNENWTRQCARRCHARYI